jgi:hypothetical protein
MALIYIKRNDAGVVYFEPSPADLDSQSDFAVWANLDKNAPHQPTLKGQAVDWWMSDPLPPFVDGQPAATSPAVNLTGTAPLTYVDGLDTSVEGTINFVSTPLP